MTEVGGGVSDGGGGGGGGNVLDGTTIGVKVGGGGGGGSVGGATVAVAGAVGGGGKVMVGGGASFSQFSLNLAWPLYSTYCTCNECDPALSTRVPVTTRLPLVA